MNVLIGIAIGLFLWFLVRVVLLGVYTVDQNERAVKTRFGRAERVPGGKTTLDDPIAEHLRPEERERYTYPQVRVIPPGGPYFKMPWEKDPQSLDRHHDRQHGARPGRSRAPTKAARASKPSPKISSTPDSPARSATASARAISTPSSSASRSLSSTSWPISSPSSASASPTSKPSRADRPRCHCRPDNRCRSAAAAK